MDHHRIVDHPRAFLAIGFLARAFAHQRGNVALEVAQTSFARVAVRDETQHFVGELEVLVGYTVLFQQPRQHIAPGDLDLFLDGVTKHTNHFHSVAQRRRNVVEVVGSADEKNAGEIEGQVQIVVDKVGVLRWIEYFQHRCGRIA